VIHAALLAVCLIGQGAADSSDLTSRVATLVRQLDAPEKANRDEAERALAALGPSILDLLPQANVAASAEIRLRVSRIRAQLERALAESVSQASKITLHGDGLPLANLLTSIEKQTGNQLIDYRRQFGDAARDVKLTLALDDVPFWKAVDQILDQGRLTLYNYGSDNALAIVNRPQSQPPRYDHATYVGAFRIAPTGLTSHLDLLDPSRRTLQLNVEIAWEPRVAPILMTLAGQRLTGRDDLGGALKLEAAGRDVELDITPGSATVNMPIQLELPPRDARRITTLSGVIGAVIPGKVEEFRFADPAKAKKVEQRHGSVVVTLDEARRNKSLWEVSIRVSYAEAGQALESHRNWVFNNAAWLESPTGERIEFGGMETTRQTEREVGVAYLFAAPENLEGYTFVYRTPSAIVSTPIAFELRDIELP
jgi:hypothetical protein